MAGKKYAVVGCTFKFVNPVHSGQVSIITLPSSKDKFGNFVYTSPINILIANGSNGADISAATGTGVVEATAIKNKSGGNFIMRKGDRNQIPIIMTGTNSNPPPPTLTYATIVEIDDPGQIKAEGR